LFQLAIPAARVTVGGSCSLSTEPVLLSEQQLQVAIPATVTASIVGLESESRHRCVACGTNAVAFFSLSVGLGGAGGNKRQVQGSFWRVISGDSDADITACAWGVLFQRGMLLLLLDSGTCHLSEHTGLCRLMRGAFVPRAWPIALWLRRTGVLAMSVHLTARPCCEIKRALPVPHASHPRQGGCRARQGGMSEGHMVGRLAICGFGILGLVCDWLYPGGGWLVPLWRDVLLGWLLGFGLSRQPVSEQPPLCFLNLHLPQD
jgi:hypothetical protein